MLTFLENYGPGAGDSHESVSPGWYVSNLEVRSRVCIPPKDSYLPEY